ncbi:MAG: glycosyl hydrolase, partial [Actinotalea sp.]|nr:glycosyl hydrolase [Actinotalea sp.]
LRPDGGLDLVVTIANTGPRDGHEVVQAYLEGPADDPVRPVRWLAGFAAQHVPAGATAQVVVAVRRRELETWDPELHRWVLPAGDYRVRVGRSIGDLRLTGTITVPG